MQALAEEGGVNPMQEGLRIHRNPQQSPKIPFDTMSYKLYYVNQEMRAFCPRPCLPQASPCFSPVPFS